MVKKVDTATVLSQLSMCIGRIGQFMEIWNRRGFVVGFVLFFCDGRQFIFFRHFINASFTSTVFVKKFSIYDAEYLPRNSWEFVLYEKYAPLFTERSLSALNCC